MIAVLRGENVREQSRPGQAALDWTARRRGLHNRVAAAAAQLGTHMADDHEAGRNVVEYFGDIFAQLAQRAATLRAGLLLQAHAVLVLARKMFGKWAPRWLPPAEACTMP